MALVLDRHTGYVSPQFHIKVDKGFYTLQQERLKSTWQVATGFEEGPQPGIAIKQNKRKYLATRGNTNSEGDGAPISQPGPEVEQFRDQNDRSTKPKTTMDAPLEPADAASAHEPEQQAKVKQNHDGLGLGTPAAKDESHLRRSSRVPKPIKRLTYAHLAEVNSADALIPGEIFTLSALFPHNQTDNEADPLYAYKASTDPDTMYMHEAMREPDADKFREAMQKEVDDLLGNGNFFLIKQNKVPKGQIILPVAWQMKPKHDIKTHKVKKYKARLNIDGSRMKTGEHYNQMYAPVAYWTSVRLLLALASIHNWHTTQVDCVGIPSSTS